MKDKVLKFRYINYKGEEADRTILPDNIYFGSTEYHPEPQWLLQGLDLDKNETRIFAIINITKFYKK